MGVENTNKPTGWEKPRTGKARHNKRAHTNGRKGNPRTSRQEDQRDHTIESHRTPTTEVHPTKTASKAHQIHRNKQKELPNMGRKKNNLKSKGMEASPLKELNEMGQTNYKIWNSKDS